MLNTSVKIAFFGNSHFSLLVLEDLKKLGIVPNLVVTAPDKPVGRKMLLTPSPTKIWAENNSIEYVEPLKLKDESFLNKIREYDLFIVASYGKIIPKIVIDMPKYHVLNIHPSLLPKYRGPSPLQTQILENEKEVGVSVMLIDEAVDHGPVLAAEKVEIENWPVGFHTLEKTLAKEGSVLLAEVLLPWIKADAKAKEQDHSKATFTKKVEKTDGLIKLSDDAYKNYLKILAYEDWPKTYFEIERSGRLIRVIITQATFKNGELQILKVIPEGKKEMSYADFMRGQH